MSAISFLAYLATFSVLIPATWCIIYLFEGEACTLKDGSDGICGTFSDCGSAFSFPRNPPVICSPRGLDDDIICCPPEYIKTTMPPPPTPTPTPPTPPPPPPKPKPRLKEYEDTDSCSLLVDRDDQQVKESLSGKACRMYTETHDKNMRADHIIGGEIVLDMSKYPFMASLGYEVNVTKDGVNVIDIAYNCGGMLISDRFVLTAAHCDRPEGPVKVRMGAVNMTGDDPKSKTLDVEKLIAHPCYRMDEPYYDIALVKLAEAISVTPYIFPACICMDPEPEVNRDYTATGWGATTMLGSSSSANLLSAFLRVEHPDDCSSKWQSDKNSLPRGFAENTMMCAINPVEGATCRGDSGGPLSVRNTSAHFTVIGVISRGGAACGDIDKPDILTKIYPFLLWIEDVVWPDGNVTPLQWADDQEEYNDCGDGSELSC